ncbi:MAG TPA: plastocyanin/azurin family copper-binding protein [Actinomycetota bacterium]|nr:plastocyanin/azurin family copper-binding protein [Actinomycetota bacterium]
MNDTARPDLMGEMRFKIPLPIVIPLVALVVIGGLAWGFSRVLLELPKEGATIVALAVAANVLGGCAYFALRPRMSQMSMVELLIVVLYPVLIGVVIAQVGFGAETEHGTENHTTPPAGGGMTSAVVASGVAFDLSTITLTAGEDVSLEFDNQDTGTPHNIAIYKNEADAQAFKNAIFDGADTTGPATTTYEFTAPDKGTYYFQCDIHPGMKGDVVAK